MVQFVVMVVLLGLFVALVPMVALNAATRRVLQEQTDTLLIPVAGGATIYIGGLVDSDFFGYAVPAADADYHIFEGLAICQCDANGNRVRTLNDVIDNSAGADGDIYVLVRRLGRIRIHTVDAVDQSAMSAQCYVADDNTVAVSQASVVNLVECGRVDRIIAADEIEMSLLCGTHCNGRIWAAGVTTTAAVTTTTAAA
jgi:hypothetical protein